MRLPTTISLMAILLFLLSSCSDNSLEIKRGFYYWSSAEESISTAESKRLSDLNIERLYVKFFEVSRSAEGNIPIAKTSLQQPKLSPELEIVPCIYIRNEVFIQSSREEILELTENVEHLIRKYLKERFQQPEKPSEIQVDCDWTPSSKDNYFFFLTKLKECMKCTFSCTLRLYPYKFPSKMGTPPVDRVMLMCYNLLTTKDYPDKNSILDLSELEKYLKGAEKYPKEIDVALPLYSNVLCYDQVSFKGVGHGDYQSLLTELQQDDSLWYTVLKDTNFQDIYLRPGDRIKLEKIRTDELIAAIDILKENTSFNGKMNVSFFHLNEPELKPYSNETLDLLYSSFSE